MEQSHEGITLYWNFGSQPSRSVKALLLIGKIPHKEVDIDILKREHKGEEYLKINPRGLLPYLRDGDFKISESNAILKYLCNTHDTIPEHYYPKDLKLRYRVEMFLEYN